MSVFAFQFLTRTKPLSQDLSCGMPDGRLKSAERRGKREEGILARVGGCQDTNRLLGTPYSTPYVSDHLSEWVLGGQ